MTYEELQTLRTQADAELNSGNYDQAEKLANDVLAQLEEPHLNPPPKGGLVDSNSDSNSFPTGEGRDGVLLRSEATRLLGVVSGRRGNYPKALEHFNSALHLSEEISDKAGIAMVLGNIGFLYCLLSDYSEALRYCIKALSIGEELENKTGIARNLVNIGVIYWHLSDYPKALEYYQKALIMYEQIHDKEGEATTLGNIGTVHHTLKNLPKALEFYGKALYVDEELENKTDVARHLGNIGGVYMNLSDFPKALEYYTKALSIDEELANKSGLASGLGNIGTVYSKIRFCGFNPTLAEEYLLKAIDICKEIGIKSYLVELLPTLSGLYEQEKRWEEAHLQYKKYIEIKEELNIEEIKKQESIREHRKEIELAKATADAKHQATEELLHNVLPPSIAFRILEGEKLIAEKLPSVSVLFADIVNFTKLSQRISPEELVEGLDRIFSAFDSLAEKHGLEKIKTIGDAYMVVAGAPEPREDHADAMAKFALEMQEAIKEFKSVSTGEQIQLRIGIHSGEVVAGVIGKNKFAYDLWGDAVNTASRMESHGEAGRIHVSEEFIEHLTQALSKGEGLQDSISFPIGEGRDGVSFTSRGEMEIKGKGMMRTFFLERI